MRLRRKFNRQLNQVAKVEKKSRNQKKYSIKHKRKKRFTGEFQKLNMYKLELDHKAGVE